eukprot:1338046-Amphidinium_carterae.1
MVFDASALRVSDRKHKKIHLRLWTAVMMRATKARQCKRSSPPPAGHHEYLAFCFYKSNIQFTHPHPTEPPEYEN